MRAMRPAHLALPLCLAACATAGRGGSPVGFVDPRMAASAAADSARKVEFHLDASGAITKFTVEHAGPAAAPEALRKKVEATWPGATALSYEKEFYADVGLVDELEVKTSDGRECELSMTAAGALNYTECKLPAATLPAAVTAAIASAVPGATVSEAELRKPATGPEEFRIEATAGGRAYYLRIAPDGSLREKRVQLPAELTVPAN